MDNIGWLLSTSLYPSVYTAAISPSGTDSIVWCHTSGIESSSILVTRCGALLRERLQIVTSTVLLYAVPYSVALRHIVNLASLAGDMMHL